MFYSFQTPSKATSMQKITDAPKKADPRINPNQGPYIFQAEEKYGQTLTEPFDNQVHYVGTYLPRFTRYESRAIMGAHYPDASAYSKAVRNLKNNKTEKNRNSAVAFFTDMLAPLINHNQQIVIAAVPTSTPSKIDFHGITRIARDIAHLTNNIDGSTVITRTEAKKPCHKGGAMTKEAILKGLHIDADQIKGKMVLLVDDVVRTGKNMRVIADLLYEYDAARVVCLALSGVLNKANRNIGQLSVLEQYLRKNIEENQTAEFKKESLGHVFSAASRAFPKTPQAESSSLIRARITEASKQNAHRLDFGTEPLKRERDSEDSTQKKKLRLL